MAQDLTSIDARILRLLQEALGRQPLEQRYGTWTQQDFLEFDRALRNQRSIDRIERPGCQDLGP